MSWANSRCVYKFPSAKKCTRIYDLVTIYLPLFIYDPYTPLLVITQMVCRQTIQ